MFYDISITLNENVPVYLGDPVFEKTPIKIGGKNSRVNLNQLNIGTHTGTHVDAPTHLFSDKKSITDISLEAFLGPCYVIEVNSFILIEEILTKIPLDSERILFKANSQLPLSKNWLDDYQGMPSSFAQKLLENRVKKPLLIGIDALSIEERGKKELETHKILLENEIVILEGLNLSMIESGFYYLYALPLKLQGLDGSPVRAVLQK